MLAEEKSKRKQRAEEAMERAKRMMREADQNDAVAKRKKVNRYKYMVGGIVMKYLSNMLRYDEEELNRIIAGALKSEQAQSIIKLVEREGSEKKTPDTAIIKNEREGGDESI